MDPVVTKLVFAGIMSVAAVVWVISLRLALQLKALPPPDVDPFAPFTAEPTGATTSDIRSSNLPAIQGQRTVQGSPESVSAALARAMAQTGYPGLFSRLFTIDEHTAQRLVIRKTGPLVCNQPTGMYFSELEFQFVSQGENRVLVTYQIGFKRLRRQLRRTALILILGVGLPVISILGSLIWLLVVSHPNPFVRWQVLQSLQAVHVLWPPFLVIYFYGAGRRHARTWVSNVLGSIDSGPMATGAADRSTA